MWAAARALETGAAGDRRPTAGSVLTDDRSSLRLSLGSAASRVLAPAQSRAGRPGSITPPRAPATARGPPRAQGGLCDQGRGP